MDWATQLELLGDRAQAAPVSAFPVDPDSLGIGGLYAWWADDEGRRLIGNALGSAIPALVYIGKAGGGRSTETLLRRIRGKHLRGSIRTSTLRHSLTAVLMTDPGFSALHPDPIAPATREAVSRWMAEHLHVTAVPLADAEAVLLAEAEAITRFDPPLNLEGTPRTPARIRLSALRALHPRDSATPPGSTAQDV